MMSTTMNEDYILLIFVIILVVQLQSGTSLPTRSRRQTTLASFRVISNTSVPCANLTSMLASGRRSGSSTSRDDDIDELTEESLMALMEMRGVHPDPNYAAVSREQAVEQFGNLFPFDEDFLEIIMSTTNAGRRSLLKSDIRSYIQQLAMDNETIPHGLYIPSPYQSSEDGHVDNTDNLNTNQGGSTSDTSQSLRSKRQTTNNIDNLDTNQDASHTIRSKRQATSDIAIDYCFPRGQPAVGGTYLHLCAACAATRFLGNNYWPNTLNEVICDTADDGCLYGAEGSQSSNIIPHGRCAPVIQPLNVLRKIDDMCILVLQDGQHLVTNEWVEETIYTSVGCCCQVSSTSWMANFV